MGFILEIVLRMIWRKGASDETSVFDYFIGAQLVAIVIVVSLAGFSAFSKPW